MTSRASVAVSVVVPTYNHAAHVVSAVESALGQTRPPREVIVVDDGSPDDTGERLAPLAAAGRIRYVRQANAGVAAARNHGASLASGELLCFVDDDDLLLPHALATLAEPAVARPELALVYGQRLVFRDGPLEPFRHSKAERGLARVIGASRFVEGWLSTYEKGVKRPVAQGLGSELNRDPKYGVGTTEYMRSVGGYAITLECGQHDDPQSPEVAYRAIRNALVHLGIATPNYAWLEYFLGYSLSTPRDLFPVVLDINGTAYDAPTAPGLGVEFNEDVVADHPYMEWIAPRYYRRDGAYTNW